MKNTSLFLLFPQAAKPSTNFIKNWSWITSCYLKLHIVNTNLILKKNQQKSSNIMQSCVTGIFSTNKASLHQKLIYAVNFKCIWKKKCSPNCYVWFSVSLKADLFSNLLHQCFILKFILSIGKWGSSGWWLEVVSERGSGKLFHCCVIYTCICM